MLNNNYKNEAIKLMEGLKKAEETRIAMIKEAQETLVVLGAESNCNTVVENIININKGKIVKINNNELEEKYNKLYDEYSALNNSYGELDEAYEILANDLANRNAKIATLKVTIEELKLDLDYEKELYNTEFKKLEKELFESDNTINELNIQLENALKQIAELKMAAKTVEPLTTEEIIVEEVKEESKIIPAKFVKCDCNDCSYRPTREEILAHIYYVYNVPEELRNHEIIEKMVEEYNEKFDKREARVVGCLKQTRKIMDSNSSFGSKFVVLRAKAGYKHYKVEERIAQEQKEEELRAKRNADRPVFNNVQTTKGQNEKGEYTYEAKGTVTVDNKDYQFIFRNSHAMACVFGCFNKEIIRKVTNEIKYVYMVASNDKKYINKIENNDELTRLDVNNKIFAYQANENIIKGYVEGYAFVWNTKEELPCGTPIKNALANNYRKMNASWGNGFVQRAQMIKDFCIDNFYIDMPANEEVRVYSEEELDDDLL